MDKLAPHTPPLPFLPLSPRLSIFGHCSSLFGISYPLNLGNYLQNRQQLFAQKQSEVKKTENAHAPRVQFVDRNQ
jgi:hypothetical protein